MQAFTSEQSHDATFHWGKWRLTFVRMYYILRQVHRSGAYPCPRAWAATCPGNSICPVNGPSPALGAVAKRSPHDGEALGKLVSCALATPMAPRGACCAGRCECDLWLTQLHQVSRRGALLLLDHTHSAVCFDDFSQLELPALLRAVAVPPVQIAAWSGGFAQGWNQDPERRE